jgi:hypothetical protein
LAQADLACKSAPMDEAEETENGVKISAGTAHATRRAFGEGGGRGEAGGPEVVPPRQCVMTFCYAMKMWMREQNSAR